MGRIGAYMRVIITILAFFICAQSASAGGSAPRERDVEVRCVTTDSTYYDNLETKGTQSGNSGNSNCQPSMNKRGTYKADIGETIAIKYSWCTKTKQITAFHGSQYYSDVACVGETLFGTHNLIVTPGRDPIKITLRNHLLEINQ